MFLNTYQLIIIYLFKLHITPIWVKQLQYKGIQTYKKQKKQKHTNIIFKIKIKYITSVALHFQYINDEAECPFI